MEITDPAKLPMMNIKAIPIMCLEIIAFYHPRVALETKLRMD